jgi:hypothetical protein
MRPPCEAAVGWEVGFPPHRHAPHCGVGDQNHADAFDLESAALSVIR